MKSIKAEDKREVRNYLIWGAISAVLNVGIYQFFIQVGMDYRESNVRALIINRFFCYVTNKFFVFKIKSKNIWFLLKEIISFFLARMVTFFIDYFGVILLVELFGVSSFISKVMTAVVIVISNYFFSKLFVFKKG